MAYTNNQGNERKAVNTSGYTMSGDKVSTSCRLSVEYFENIKNKDSLLKLTFTPELPENERSSSSRWAHKQAIQTALSVDKAYALAMKYKETIKPAIEKGELKSVAVILSEVNLVVLSSGATNGIARPSISIYKGLNPQSRTCETSLTYTFGMTDIVNDYDPETGAFGAMEKVSAELEGFIEVLRSFIIANSNMFVHSERTVNRFSKELVTEKLIKIGEKVGVDLSYKPNNYQRTSYGPIFTDNGGSNGAPTESVGSLEDIDF